MKLRDWFSKYHNRPLKIAAAFLIAVWFVFAYRSYEDVTQKQNLAATQIADLLSLSVGSKDRTMTESLLEALVEQSGASSAAICDGSRQFLAANQDFSGCGGDISRFKTVVERQISGSKSLRLKVTFDWIQNFASSLTLLVFGLMLVVSGFYFIQMAQRQIERGILSPLMNKLLTDERLEIDELNDLQRKVREFQKIEAQKAAALAIEENNQQVAHDIRGPIAAINELLKLAPISDAKFQSALDKAVDRINSVANGLLSQEVSQSEVEAPAVYDLAAAIQDIAAEKRLLFSGGSIETHLATHLIIETKLPQALFARILSNVIDNAMTACLSQKHICITSRMTDSCVEVSVKDTGVGIDAESLKRVGEKGFSLLKPSGAKGTGRGVFSAKRILGEIGGGIAFSSAVGEGTTVVLRVPARTISAEWSSMDLILVDNDDLVRMVWTAKAETHGLKVGCFSSVAELMAFEENIPREIPIFLDSDLGNKERGEAFAPRLRDLGFQSIYLTTNYADLHGAHMTGVEAAIPKNFEHAMSLLLSEKPKVGTDVSAFV